MVCLASPLSLDRQHGRDKIEEGPFGAVWIVRPLRHVELRFGRVTFHARHYYAEGVAT